MLRFTIRDGLWLVALVVLAAAWWLDRSMLAINLANCRFVLERQRETINALAKPAHVP